MSPVIRRPGVQNRLALVVAAAMCLLAACGGHSGTAEDPAVASIPRSAAPSGAADPVAHASASASAERPLIRADTSDEEFNRLWQLYYGCLRDEGIPTLNQNGHLKPMDDGGPKYAPQREACAPKQPEDYKDRLARTDPSEYQDRFRAWIECMRSKGMKVSPAKGGGFQFDDDSRMTEEAFRISDECEAEAFGGK
ncbi:hypothetical protein [Planotetraspora mira]|uniref:Lipoprotein n=1 Tax=Planotetraspora mira TaxID=58121 RepID=A0A8J3TPS6_9ACTN|nr:hypothetical protein [Planotetraspora mira]GII29807.1 hypothetical protein Pmi06nite_32490 [Planotetraspora mira]